MLFAGVSAVVAGVPLYRDAPRGPRRKSDRRRLVSAEWRVRGFRSRGDVSVTRRRAQGLPNERATTSDAERPRCRRPVDRAGHRPGRMLPVWLLLRLQPFLAEWSRVIGLLATSDIWKERTRTCGGIVLVPLAGALTPPLFELAALFAFVVASAVLLALLLSRSRRFPRIYIVCGVLLSALVIASVRGADAAMLAGEAVRATHRRHERKRRGIGPVDGWSSTRYTSIVGSTAPVLAWALCGYLGWVPAMILLATGSDNVCEPASTIASRASSRAHSASKPSRALRAFQAERPIAAASSDVATAAWRRAPAATSPLKSDPGR